MREATQTVGRDSLLRRALLLVWAGEIWNIGEMVAGLWAGFQAGSIALIAFGFDSVVEVFAGGVAIWTLRGKGRTVERKAIRLLGLTFFLLSAYIAVQSSVTLLGSAEEPRQSPIGIALILATIVSMTLLYRAKSGIAKKLGSSVLRAEAVENLVCDLQDLTVLVGLGLNFFFGWWWADPVSALLLIPFLVREGLGSFRE